MEIIKAGKPKEQRKKYVPLWVGHEFRCDICECVFKLNEDDGDLVQFGRMFDPVVQCPTCHNWMTIVMDNKLINLAEAI